MFILLEMIPRCSPLPSTRRHCHLMLLHLMQGLCSHPPAAVVPSMAAELPLLGALVTCSKAAMMTNWSFTDLAAVIKLQLLMGCQVLELLGGVLEGVGVRVGLEHFMQQEVGGGQKQAHQQQVEVGEGQKQARQQQQQQELAGDQQQAYQQQQQQEAGGAQNQAYQQQQQQEVGGDQKQAHQQQQHVVGEVQKQAQQQQQEEVGGGQKQAHTQQQQQQELTQKGPQPSECPDSQQPQPQQQQGMDGKLVGKAAAQVAVGAVVVKAIRAVAEAGFQARDTYQGKPSRDLLAAVAAAATDAAAAELEAAPALAAVDTALKDHMLQAIISGTKDWIVAWKAARAKPSSEQVKAIRAIAKAAADRVILSEAGIALVEAVANAAADGESAQQQQDGKDEGRSQGHGIPCLKEQVEGLLWAGLFSINSACDLLQRLSCMVAMAAGGGIDLGQQQCTARHGSAYQMLLAAISKAEEAWATQSLAAAAGGSEGVRSSTGDSEHAAGGLRAAAACGVAGGEFGLGTGAACSGSSSASSLVTSNALQEVEGHAEAFIELLQEQVCFTLVNDRSNTPIVQYSLLEQQGPRFMLQAASHVAMVRQLDWESTWVEQCGCISSSSARSRGGPASVRHQEPDGLYQGSSCEVGKPAADGGRMDLFVLLAAAGDMLHDVVQKLPQQLLVEASVLGEVQRKVVGWRGIEVAGRTAGDIRTEQQQQQVAAGEDYYRGFVELFLVVQSCLWGIPVGFCCNNVGCRTVKGMSELAQVYGEESAGGFCQGCKVACYCSAECQHSAWPFHRHACPFACKY